MQARSWLDVIGSAYADVVVNSMRRQADANGKIPRTVQETDLGQMEMAMDLMSGRWL
jgi:hypothetical protein